MVSSPPYMRVSVSPAHVSEVRVAVSRIWVHRRPQPRSHEVRVEKAPKRLPGESRTGYTEPTLRPTRRRLRSDTSLVMQYCSFSRHAVTSAEGSSNAGLNLT